MSDSYPCVPVAPSTKVKNVVSSAELFADIVISAAVFDGVENDKLPLPSVPKNCPELPLLTGSTKLKLALIVAGALIVTLCELSAS